MTKPTTPAGIRRAERISQLRSLGWHVSSAINHARHPNHHGAFTVAAAALHERLGDHPTDQPHVTAADPNQSLPTPTKHGSTPSTNNNTENEEEP